MNSSNASGNASGDGTPKKPLTERVLKWVAALSAVISLVFAVQKLAQLMAENGDRSRRIDELTQVADRQKQSGDYSLAWESLAAANKQADAGGTFARMSGNLDDDTQKIRLAKEDLAMVWLDNISVPSGQGFSVTVEKLMPTLEEGVLASQATRKGDLLAHIGWGYFLRGRDGAQRIDPLPQYRQAIAADQANPYAHASWGHWVLWNGGKFEEANEHFRKALAADRGRDRVRELQLSAYRNRGASADTAYVTVIADMVKNKEAIDKAAQKPALWHLTRACAQTGSQELLKELKTAIPKSELPEVYRSLLDEPRDAAEREKQTQCMDALKS
jgi:tetratricopeptide (TPR) repeat protein